MLLLLFIYEALRIESSHAPLHPLAVQVLIIGGGIANFTDVAATFTGIITALKQYAEALRDGNISIWVRRAGPNYQEVCRATRMSVIFHVEKKASPRIYVSSSQQRAYVRRCVVFCPPDALVHLDNVPRSAYARRSSLLKYLACTEFQYRCIVLPALPFVNSLMSRRNTGTSQDPGDRGVYRCPDPRVWPGDPHHRCRSDGSGSCRRELCTGV